MKKKKRYDNQDDLKDGDSVAELRLCFPSADCRVSERSRKLEGLAPLHYAAEARLTEEMPVYAAPNPNA